jgi:hypothetical protein
LAQLEGEVQQSHIRRGNACPVVVGHDLVQLALWDAERAQHMVVGSDAISVVMCGRNVQENALLLGSREGALFQENGTRDAGLCLDGAG